MIKIAIVDDHKMFRDGIAYILNATEGYQVLWTAEDSKATLDKLNSNPPDVLLMDISLGEENGIDLTNKLLSQNENLLILGLSMHHEEEYIIQMIENGAKGYLLKDAGVEELKKAIEKVVAGQYYYNETVMRSLIQRVKQPNNGSSASDSNNILTDREIEILKLVVEEMSNQEISETLFISPRTVESHKRNMISKLDVKNSIGLVRYALENNIVSSKISSAS